MKKLFCLLLVCCTALFGCSSSWDKTCTYKGSEGGLTTETTTLLKADKDGNITKVKTTSIFIAETEAEAIIAEGASLLVKDEFAKAGLDGIDVSVKRDGKKVTMVMTVDVEKVAANSTLPDGLIEVGLTLDEMVNLLEEEQGCTCK